MEKHVLSNGLTVLLSPINHVRSVSVGIFAKTGSAHEDAAQSGVSHFLEHMLFKGTESRNAKQIASAIEGKGGMLNAWTDKEQTCYYMRVVDTEIDTAIDVLSDMYQRSKFDPEELTLEKGVVLEEIARAQDDPESYVHDLYMSTRWKESPHGREILGSTKTVKKLMSSHLHEYVTKRYTAPNSVVSVAGNFDPANTLESIKRHFGGLSDKAPTEQNFALNSNLGHLSMSKDVEQACFCIGFEGLCVTDPRRHAMKVLNTAFGAEMYSRMFQQIRERRGLAYSVGSYSISYKPGGLFIAYGGINYENWGKVQQIVFDEINDISANGLKDDELQISRDTLVGQAVLWNETPMAIMTKQAQDEIAFGQEITLDQQIKDIQGVTNEQIIDLVRSNCCEDKSSRAIICPKKVKRRGILETV